MNYLTKSVISKLESSIYNNSPYDIGKMVAEVITLFAENNVEGGDPDAFMAGINDGLGWPEKTIQNERN
jgi:hypothetical protein